MYLYFKDEAEIRDFFVKMKFDDRTSKDSDVTVTVDVHICALFNKAGTTYQISTYVLSDDGTRVAAEDKELELVTKHRSFGMLIGLSRT